MEFKDVVKVRYSCKKYSGRQVEPNKLASILEAGRLAPTAKNLQEQHIYVIQSEDALEKVDAVTPCRAFFFGQHSFLRDEKGLARSRENDARREAAQDVLLAVGKPFHELHHIDAHPRAQCADKKPDRRCGLPFARACVNLKHLFAPLSLAFPVGEKRASGTFLGSQR